MTQPLSIVVAADWAPIRALEPVVSGSTRGPSTAICSRSSAAPI